MKTGYLIDMDGVICRENQLVPGAGEFAEALIPATNPDNWCPISSSETRPGAGSTAAFREASTGRRPYSRASSSARSQSQPSPAAIVHGEVREQVSDARPGDDDGE